MFIPTGAYPRDDYKSGALKNPPEEDLKAIQTFIGYANGLLSDDTVREKAGIKLSDLRFVVRVPAGFNLPTYRPSEREACERFPVALDLCRTNVHALPLLSGALAPPLHAGIRESLSLGL